MHNEPTRRRRRRRRYQYGTNPNRPNPIRDAKDKGTEFLTGRSRSTPHRSSRSGGTVQLNGTTRKIGSSAKNAPPKPKAGNWLPNGARVGFRDGGPAAPGSAMPNQNAIDNANQNAAFKRQTNFNLENNSDLAQGSHHPWAQPTSVSSLISGLMRQSAGATADYWDQWAANKGGGIQTVGGQTPWYAQPSFMAGSSQLAASNPFGAFGTNMVMDGYTNGAMLEQEEVDTDGSFAGWTNQTSALGGTGIAFMDDRDRLDWMNYDRAGYLAAEKAAQDAYRFTNGSEQNKLDASSAIKKKLYAEFYNKYTTQRYGEREKILAPNGMDWIANPNYKPPTTGGPAPTPTPGTGNPGGPVQPTAPKAPTAPPHVPVDTGIPNAFPTGGGLGEGGVFNPWGRAQGAENNAYGVSPTYLAQTTMESMALANAYFAPQRMELAYQLGDMETDMRRLAVNLGRQVDDPVLQAQLYKEGMKAVRTLDVNNNTFAFQMAEQRRREEVQNFQFYDQLAQEEARLKFANRQFYDNFDLQKRVYNLTNFQVANQPGPSTTTTPGATTTPQQQEQEWYSGAQNLSSKPAGASISGIYANLTKSPYTSSMGGTGNITRSRLV